MLHHYGKMTMQKIATEAQHQEALFSWWALVHHRYGLPECALIHIPNEGKRSVQNALRLKRQGLRKGCSDILLCAHNSKFHGLWIELKRWGGRATQEQLDFIEAMKDCGYDGAVCIEWETARDKVTEYLAG
jgi:hypothetical protein